MDGIIQKYLHEKSIRGEIIGSIDELISILDDIKPEVLYKSHFHGLYHSQKVTYFAYLIGKVQNLDKNDMKILLDASKYHDIGRDDDNESNLHGFISAKKIDSVVSYENEADMYYLKAIVDDHCRNDERDTNIVFSYWESEYQEKYGEDKKLDFERFKTLSDILKDADALDRKRFQNCSAVLEEKFLRTETSKKLVKEAENINNYYRRVEIEEKYKLLKEKYEKNTIDKFMCYHSVGFDFFKALSILQRGILSHYYAKINGISITRNFHGNNGEFWISVVNADSTLEQTEAFDKYVKNGLSFLCYVNELVDGVERPKDNGSISPRRSEEYHDEKFVFNKIPVENIQFLSIPRQLVDARIDELDYIYCNSQYELINQCVTNYLDEIDNYCDIKVNRNEFNRKLDELKKLQFEYNNLSRGEINKNIEDIYYKKIDLIKAELNFMMCKWMQIGFSERMGKTKGEIITLGEVVKHILESSNIDYSVVDELINEDNDQYIKFPTFKDEDSYFLRLSTFDLSKDYNTRSRTQ